jgi:DNA-directed RNA polymerase subunit M/transcription elongation factor TFIIS
MPPKKETVQALLLTQKAEVKEITITLGADRKLTMPIIKATLKKKEAPEVVGTYKYKSQTLFLFGYTVGKAGTENKHELPPPHDTMLCFGDIILLASKDESDWTHPLAFKSTDYEVFYTKAFGGFEDLDEEEEEEEEEEDTTNDIEEDVDVLEEDEEDLEEGDEAKGLEDTEICEEPIIVPKKRVKKPAATSIVSAGAAQVYASYFHVEASKELVEEAYESPYTGESLISHRQKILSTLSKLFHNLLDEQELNNLERCAYNSAIRRASQRHIGKIWSHTPFLELYIMVAKQIAVNLLPTAYVNNTELFAKYKAGEVTFKDISEMDSYQLFEERWKDCFLEQQIREKRQLEGNKAMATDRFLCKRCHKRECTYYELQTRSADEPMTIFITCLNCGKHWKE